MLSIDPTLPAELGPLQWLIGDWEGTGVVAYKIGEDLVEFEFGQRVSFAHDGMTSLRSTSYAWQLDDDLTPVASEVGLWRIGFARDHRDAGPGMLPATGEARNSDDIDAVRDGEGAFELQAQIVHGTGVAELYIGTIAGPRIDLATDAVVSAPGSKEHAASTRMMGLVDGHLLWAWDIAALGQPLATHASARLSRAQEQ